MKSSTRPDIEPITTANFAARARDRLYAEPPFADPNGQIAHPSDFDLNPGNWGDVVPGLTFRSAAVLVPIVARSEPAVLLTQRTHTLPKHAGQISFPGGTTEASDRAPIDTALRETHEEIGLDASVIQPLGYLDPYRSGTGFLITPVVALVEPDIALTLNAGEVDNVFEVPLAYLMDPANHRVEARDVGGRERLFYAITYGERYIWGITAGIVRNLYERVVRP
jgi:8-oxo-dGTP pyrophosphatase MutT (NUDIX family)